MKLQAVSENAAVFNSNLEFVKKTSQELALNISEFGASYASIFQSAKRTAGAASLEASVRQTLAEGIQVGGLASDPEPVVTVPNVLSLSSAQRASRVLPNVTFTARLAGAIRAVNISGSVYA